MDFAALLETRLRLTVPTTVDSVRYTLFASMLRNDIEPDAIILEFPHPDISRGSPTSGARPLSSNSSTTENHQGGRIPPRRKMPEPYSPI